MRSQTQAPYGLVTAGAARPTAACGRADTSSDFDGDGRKDVMQVCRSSSGGKAGYRVTVRTAKKQVATLFFAPTGRYQFSDMALTSVVTGPADGIKGDDLAVNLGDDRSGTTTYAAYSLRKGALVGIPAPGSKKNQWKVNWGIGAQGYKVATGIHTHYEERSLVARVGRVERLGKGVASFIGREYEWRKGGWVFIGDVRDRGQVESSYASTYWLGIGFADENDEPGVGD